MNTAVRKVGLLLTVIFLMLFANLNYIQLAKSRELTEHERNPREDQLIYGIHRGEILAADNTVLARSEPTGDDRYQFRRAYPLGGLFGQITGYATYRAFCGSSGLEATYNDYLLGLAPESTETFVDSLLGRRPDGNIIKITIDPAIQKLAKKALKGQRGGVAAINPKTGAILALYGNPVYDPNLITEVPVTQCAKPKQKLERNKDRPMQSRAFADRYPPGSTFKIVTAAAGLANKMTPGTSFPNPSRLNLPDTDKSLGNYGGGSCAGGGSISIATGFRLSCNTTFAQIGMKIGAKKLAAMAKRFGVDVKPDVDLPEAVFSCVVAEPGFGCRAPELSRPATAYSSIGQQDVRMTPLGMARIAAGVANSGRVPEPYLVDTILAPDGGIIRKTEPIVSKAIYSKTVARQMRQLMIDTVRIGTGRIVGFKHAGQGIIGGKTGTAQTGTGSPPHVWFAAWGPGIAIAVVVEEGGTAGRDATGGRVAGPIAKALVDRVVAATLKAARNDG